MILSPDQPHQEESQITLQKLPRRNLGFHIQANLVEPGHSLFDKLVNGAPPMAPLLFPNLVGLALIGTWALLPHLQEPTPGRSWLGAAYDWAHPGEQTAPRT